MNEKKWITVARYALGVFVFFSYVSGVNRVCGFIISLTGDNVLGWIVCGCVGFPLYIGLIIIIMLLQGRKVF